MSLGKIFSSKIWSPIIMLIGGGMEYSRDYLGLNIPFTWIFIAALIIGVIVVGVNARMVYRIESDTEFVRDIELDVLFLIAGAVFTTLAITAWGANWQIIVLFALATVIVGWDFITSLTAGSSKLLEMDKAQVRGTFGRG